MEKETETNRSSEMFSAADVPPEWLAHLHGVTKIDNANHKSVFEQDAAALWGMCCNMRFVQYQDFESQQDAHRQFLNHSRKFGFEALHAMEQNMTCALR